MRYSQYCLLRTGPEISCLGKTAAAIPSGQPAVLQAAPPQVSPKDKTVSLLSLSKETLVVSLSPTTDGFRLLYSFQTGLSFLCTLGLSLSLT